MTEPTITRRGSLLRLGGFLVTAVGVGGWRIAESEGAGPAAVASGAVSCVLTPEQTEGPYYISGEKLRRNITEGRPGAALLLRAFVVDASTCKPIKSAVVDIWHADALGIYSGAIANNAGTNFMRGIQKTDSAGLAHFQSVYPGWYQGRAVHIHVKVHLGGSVVHTGQLFFPAEVTNAVYEKSPYRTHGTHPDTLNANDAIFRNGGSKGMLALKKSGSGYIGTIAMGVHSA